ncbi:MAG TPA: hypothetical protein VGF69_11480 [Thermoanaerobaculia bacterium]|jgi:hypothetical protein
MQWRDELTRLFPGLTKLPAGTFVVGGAVRDLLLGRPPADVDVAAPDAFAAAGALRKKVIRLGKEHLSAYRVVVGETVYDFADIQGGSIERDLTRRDFTVNAMAVDVSNDTLLDLSGGQRDVREGIVRMVRPENFDDDPLRLLKGVRMAVKYGMEIDPATLEAIRARAATIVDVAPERVTYELSVIFSSGVFRRAVALLRETGLDAPLGLRHVEFEGDDVPLAAALALLVADPRAYAERWRWSEALLRDVLTLQCLREQHDLVALYDAGERVARQLPALLRRELAMPEFTIRALLDGADITRLTGLPPGPELGRVKRALLEAQVRGEVRTREEAESFVRGSNA